MKIVHNATFGAADETTPLDAITVYDLTSHSAHAATWADDTTVLDTIAIYGFLDIYT